MINYMRDSRTRISEHLKATVAGFAIFLSIAPWSATCASETGNEATARRFYAAFNTRDFDAFDQFISADFVDHNPAPGQAAGIAGLKTSLQWFFTLSSDIKATHELVISSGDYVTVYSTTRGTQTGELLGIKATHKPFEIHTLDIWRVKNGKLVEGWHVEELLNILIQTGALPQ